MQIDSLHFDAPVLTVKCSGVFGLGSAGNPSGALIAESIERWMISHPGDQVKQLVVDYTDVEYSWGDGPVSSVIPFVKRGITEIRLLASSRNVEPLQDLVTGSNVPWFVVELGDA